MAGAKNASENNDVEGGEIGASEIAQCQRVAAAEIDHHIAAGLSGRRDHFGVGIDAAGVDIGFHIEPVIQPGEIGDRVVATVGLNIEAAPAAIADPETDTGSAQPSVVSNTPPPERISKFRNAGKAINARMSGDRKPQSALKSVKAAKKRKAPKPEIELTPDGFVKWWK